MIRINYIEIGSALLLISIFSFCVFNPITCIEFNNRTTGVVFSAYVKRSENGQAIPGWKTYTLEDIKVMLDVISGKFSKVATYGVGADNVPYVKNSTYYDCNKQVYTAEAAALINKERNEGALTILIGMWQSDFSQQMDTEVQVALESAEKANEIFPGTAKGLIFSHSDISTDLKRAHQTLTNIKKYVEDAKRLGLKVGSRQLCSGIYPESQYIGDGGSVEEKLASIRRNIVNESDFIICQMKPAEHNLPSGAEYGFLTVKNDLVGFRKDLRKINPNLEVMGETGWLSKGSKTWENIDNLQKYWKIADKFSTDHNFTMWLLEAFDNPWKNDHGAAHYGWWKLKENSKVNLADGYIEKIFAPPDEKPKMSSSTTTSPWVYVGIAIGVLIMLFVLTLITLLFMRVKKLQEVITKDDVREFMYGISDETAAQQGGDTVVESALKFPYDKSYEISKDKLKIKREALLGTGQFGCVYKALIENEESIEVALKMAKSDCPKNALKGLLSEIKILTYLGKHPNIVSIHGAYTAEILSGVVYVATELCTLGSLEGYLRNSETPTTVAPPATNRYANAPMKNAYENKETSLVSKAEITFLDMVRWSHEIACGMEYLGTKHVVHADLATRNVLLAADKTAKITDFGLSRRLYDYTNYVKQQQEPLPWRWMSIESLKRLEFSSKSDVWSFGVTLWEIFAMGDLPYPGLSWNLEFVDNLVNGLRMKCPPHATHEVYKIMVDCWHLESKSRPTFTDLKLSTAHIIDTCVGQPQSYANVSV